LKNFFKILKNGHFKNVQNRKSENSLGEKKLKKLFKASCRKKQKTKKKFCEHKFFIQILWRINGIFLLSLDGNKKSHINFWK